MRSSTLCHTMATSKLYGDGSTCGMVLLYNNIFEHGAYREQ
jgi:hypothetical protein